MAVPYFPFTGEKYEPKMGLKPLRWENWLEIDEKYAACIARKRELFRTERETVLQVYPEANDFCLELHDHLKAHIAAVAPQLCTGDLKPTRGAQALADLSTWTQEDWCLVEPKDPSRLVAGAVCFPSRWSLKEKMGKSPERVHEPVPDFSKIQAPTKNFMEKLTPERPMWRLNWTIHDSDELFCPGPHASGKVLHAGNVLEECYLRVERQTLSRLPRTGAIVFSIRTHLNPLLEAIDTPEKRELLRLSLEGLPAETAAYRGMAPFFEELKEALTD